MASAFSAVFAPASSRILFLAPRAGGGDQLVWEANMEPDAFGLQTVRVAADTVQGGDQEASLSLAEKLRRERLRQLSTGITGFQVAGSSVYFTQHRDLYRSALGASADDAAPATLVVNHSDIAADVEAPVLGASVTRDGSWVAFAHSSELYCCSLSALGAASVHQLTSGARGSVGLTNGLADYISEEEFNRHVGLWWSPCGRFLLYQNTDESGVEEYTIEGRIPCAPSSSSYSAAASTSPHSRLATSPLGRKPGEASAFRSRSHGAGGATSPATASFSAALDAPTEVYTETHRYPFAGRANPVVSLRLLDMRAVRAAGSHQERTDAAAAVLSSRHLLLHLGVSTDVYVPRVTWLPDGAGVLVQVLNRLQNCIDLVYYSSAASGGGRGRLLLRETASSGWINVDDCLTCLPRQATGSAASPSRQYFIWGSERTGFRHLYLYSFDPAATGPDAEQLQQLFDVPLKGGGVGAGGACGGEGFLVYDGPLEDVAEEARGSSGAIEWTSPRHAAGSARLERAITGGRWVVEDIAGLLTSPPAAMAATVQLQQQQQGMAPALVFFHATAQGPTELHLYSAPVFGWGGGDGKHAAIVEESTCKQGLPPTLPWFSLENSVQAVSARVAAARLAGAALDSQRLREWGIRRLTSGPGYHRCCIGTPPAPAAASSSVAAASGDAPLLMADELSCMYAAEPSLAVYAVDVAALLQPPASDPLIAHDAATAAAHALVARGGRGASTGSHERSASQPLTDPLPPPASTPLAAPLPAAAPGKDRSCCGPAELLGAFFPSFPTSEEEEGEEEGAKGGGEAGEGGRPRLRSAAAAAPPLWLHPSMRGPRDQLSRCIVPYECAGPFASSSAAAAAAATSFAAAAASSSAVRCLGVVAGQLPHPYAPTAVYLHQVGRVLGRNLLPLAPDAAAAFPDAAKTLPVPAAAGAKEASRKSVTFALNAKGDTATRGTAGASGDAAESGRQGVAPAAAAASLPGRLLGALVAPIEYIGISLGLASQPKPAAAAAVAPPAAVVPLAAPEPPPSTGAAAAAPPPPPPLHWRDSDLLGLLFPPGAVAAEGPLPAAAQHVSQRRALVPAARCFSALPLGGTPSDIPIVVAIKTAASLAVDAAASPAGGAEAAAGNGVGVDDGSFMFASITLPEGAAPAATAPSPSFLGFAGFGSAAIPSPPPASAASAGGGGWSPPPAAAAEDVPTLGRIVRNDDESIGSGGTWDPLPTVLYVYGGPCAQLVTNSCRLLRGGNSHSSLLCKAGMAVVMMDGRGSPRRGCGYERPIWLQMGSVELEDQLAGLRQLVAAGLVDPGRVGVHGWSYGGYATLLLMAHRGAPFRAGVAGAPVTDWRLYDTAYTERYMSLPGRNRDGYEAGSVLGAASARLVGRRFEVLHGELDENVHFRNSQQLEEAMERDGPAEAVKRRGAVVELGHAFLALPGERHAVRALREFVRGETVRFLRANVL